MQLPQAPTGFNFTSATGSAEAGDRFRDVLPGSRDAGSTAQFRKRFGANLLAIAWPNPSLSHTIMGLSYHFSLRAPATARPGELAEFLRRVEAEARLLGFGPTAVTEGPFDTQERRDFARRIARGLTVEDPRLRGVEPAEGLCWSAHPQDGLFRIAPVHGVVLVLTDGRGVETAFGFFRFPAVILDRAGREIMPLPRDWMSRDSLRSPDPRHRAVVALFREAGYVESERDEFAPLPCPA